VTTTPRVTTPTSGLSAILTGVSDTNTSSPSRGNRGKRGTWVYLTLAQRVNLEPMVRPDHLESRDHPDQPDQQDQWVHREWLENRDQQVTMARRVKREKQ